MVYERGTGNGEGKLTGLKDVRVVAWRGVITSGGARFPNDFRYHTIAGKCCSQRFSTSPFGKRNVLRAVLNAGVLHVAICSVNSKSAYLALKSFSQTSEHHTRQINELAVLLRPPIRKIFTLQPPVNQVHTLFFIAMRAYVSASPKMQSGVQQKWTNFYITHD
ncbi:protein rai1 [Moniliophthora roreri]|nr:hypothetical protein WG66_008862 [Moniliophthora roreri]KAI3595880.1 protein rai1 [Moniliophthora roreri]